MKQFSLKQVLSIITGVMLVPDKELRLLIDHLIPGRLTDKSFYGETLEEYQRTIQKVCSSTILQQNEQLRLRYENFTELNTEQIQQRIKQIGVNGWINEERSSKGHCKDDQNKIMKRLPDRFDFIPASNRRPGNLKKLKNKFL